MAFGIFTDDGLDQIVSTYAEAKKEKRDLKEMGCSVKGIVESDDESQFDAIHDMMRDGKSFAVAFVKAATNTKPNNPR